MKMNKKLSLTLLVAMFSLLIIGFGGAATAEAAGTCAETLQVNGASESTAFTNCRAYEADAARWNAMAAFYTNEETNVQRAFEAAAARYTGLAEFYTNETNNVQHAFEADSDSAYLAANPELMASRRFVVADGSATSQPVSVDSEDLRPRIIFSEWVIEAEAVDVSTLGQLTQGNVTSQPVSVDIEFLQHNPDYYRGR